MADNDYSEIESTLVFDDVDIGESVVLNLQFYHRQSQPINLDGCNVVFERGTYFDSAVVPIKNLKSRVTLQAFMTATIDTLPSAWEFSVKTKNGKILKEFAYVVNLSQFTKSWFEDGSGKLLLRNVFLFGVAGSGKSSLINSLYTLCDRDLRHQPTRGRAKAGGATDHVTTTFLAYRVGSFAKTTDQQLDRKSNMMVYDTWGLQENNYTNNELEWIVKGKLPLKWNMAETLDEAEMLKKKKQTGVQKGQAANMRQHCVVFCIPVDELENHLVVGNQITPNLQRAKDMVAACTKYGVRSVIAMTRADSKYPSIRTITKGSPRLPKELITLRDATANLLGCIPALVIPVANYQAEQRRDFAIEQLVFKVFSNAYELASQAISITSTDSSGGGEEGVADFD